MPVPKTQKACFPLSGLLTVTPTSVPLDGILRKFASTQWAILELDGFHGESHCNGLTFLLGRTSFPLDKIRNLHHSQDLQKDEIGIMQCSSGQSLSKLRKTSVLSARQTIGSRTNQRSNAQHIAAITYTDKYLLQTKHKF